MIKRLLPLPIPGGHVHSGVYAPVAHGHGPSEITGTAVVTADSRLSDARTPTSHGNAQHSSTFIVAADVHSNANDPAAGEKAALAGTSGTPGSGNKYVTNSDPRNTDARTPTAHGHPESEITNLVTDLAGKAAAGHDHSGVYAPVNQKLDDFGAPDDNADLNVSINAHGLMSKLPNEAMKIYTGDGSWAEFAASAGLIHVYSNAGATTRSSNDTQKSTTSSSYAKLKETKMGEPVKGVRIKFTLKTSNINYEAYGQIYRNGVAVGTERSTTSTGGEEFYEDFDAAWTTNDLIQVYAYRTGTATAYVLDFRFCYDRAIRSMGTWNLVAGLVTTEQTAYVMTNQDP